jgi:hypothetical protein
MTDDTERWTSVAFCAFSIIGLPANEQDVFLRSLLAKWFSDIPDAMPSPDADTQVLAAYAVKFRLRALVDDGSDGNKMRYAKALAFAATPVPTARKEADELERQRDRER